jgi:hypothetical protein
MVPWPSECLRETVDREGEDDGGGDFGGSAVVIVMRRRKRAMRVEVVGVENFILSKSWC